MTFCSISFFRGNLGVVGCVKKVHKVNCAFIWCRNSEVANIKLYKEGDIFGLLIAN